MPLYIFKCENCSREFEDLCKSEERDITKFCPSCGESAIRKEVTTFGISTRINPRNETVYTSKEIDKVVGDAANKAWEGYDVRWKKYYEKRQQARRAGKEIKEIKIPTNTGVSPIEYLGNSKEREFRREYNKRYREQVTEKGKSSDTPVVMKKIL